jgi:hypothetical protein
MGMFTLYAGLLLPWLGGTLWLIFVEACLNHRVRPSRVRQTGYGFFVGYAVLFLAILVSDALTGRVSWSQLMVFLLIFSVSGGLAAWFRTQSGGSPPATINPVMVSNYPAGKLQKFLMVIVLLPMSVHLLMMTLEVFTQTVYPWDAWFTWMYRSKIWFLNGGMVDMVSPVEWAASGSRDLHTVNAWKYPWFPSVIPYWSALSLGRWSETLVSLPVLFGAVAIGLALYGQCREYGLSRTASLVSCYILYSIPLFAAHIALPGYADFWMTGYVGLGFIAIMRGAASKQGFQTALGLLMVMAGMTVKDEGMVWFLAAIGLQLLLMGRLRWHFIAALLITGLLALSWFLGIQQVELPLLGSVGIADGELLIPFIGSVELERHIVLPHYWRNFLLMGSWNLLWVMVIGSIGLVLITAVKLRPGPGQRAGLGFILIFLATQVFIFGFTQQGEWAERYTAINRLPLHFLPAIIFSTVLLLHSALLQAGPAASAQKQDKVHA